MPTKTERILGYLPKSFRPDPQKSALHAVVDAFGNELLDAENSLSAVMQAHWVDHADLFAEQINDLARISALYGLAPRPDEEVEEFREHLKRYVRTFLEGTVTVQGILRVTAESLGVLIGDDYKDMDTWWSHEQDKLVSFAPRGDDIASRLFGRDAISVSGLAASRAQIVGRVNISGGVDLRENHFLSLLVDEVGPLTIDLIDGIEDHADNVSLDEITAAINDAFNAEIATHDNRFLTLTALVAGANSRIVVDDIAGDAAEAVLGLKPFEYQGRDAVGASVTSAFNHIGGIDLSTEHYLRLSIDGVEAEIDVAGGDAAHTTVNEVRDKINDVFPGVATVESHFLTLTSPIKGAASSIIFRAPAAQDATQRIFGPVQPNHFGHDDLPARFTGPQLAPRLDLSERANLMLSVDGEPLEIINCAGADPAATRPEEIVDAINDALNAPVAQLSGRAVMLHSPSNGAAGVIQIGTPPENDATEMILGLEARTFKGTDATNAHFLSPINLASGVNLMAQHRLLMALDGGVPVEIDLRNGVEDLTKATLRELAEAINNALGIDIAAQAGDFLSLTSATAGSASRIDVLPMVDQQQRRFVSRAMITDEAAREIFGFVSAQSQGSTGTQAAVVGTRDLSRGVDLREEPYLRLAIDGRDAEDIYVAGDRPYATQIREIVNKINEQIGEDIASHDGRFITLRSNLEGEESRIAIEPPQKQDARQLLLGLPPGTAFGTAPTGVRFVGLVDLSVGIDLSGGDRVSIGMDGNAPVEIALAAASADPAHVTLIEIVSALNTAIGPNVARQEKGRVVLASRLTGSASGIEFAVPASGDATAAVFGISAPRVYAGQDATPAVITGTENLSGLIDLTVNRFLRIGIGTNPPVDIDCASEWVPSLDPDAGPPEEQPKEVLPGDIVLAINKALGAPVASLVDEHLVLTSPTTGVSARLSVEIYTGGNAAFRIFGVAEADERGLPSVAAQVTGEADLSQLVDLRKRRWLRLAVDGGRPETIEIKGGAQEAVTPQEILDAINQVWPNLASLTDDDRLQLTSPTKGNRSRIEVLPLRYLEVVEYPPGWVETEPQAVRHGDALTITNDGAAETSAEVWIYAPHGVTGPTLVNSVLGWRIQICGVINPRESLHLYESPDGLRADIHTPEGEIRPLPADRIFVGPFGAQVHVPFMLSWRLRGGTYDMPTLQLNNPLEPKIVLLHARQSSALIRARAVESAALSAEVPAARGQYVRLTGRVNQHEGTYQLLGQSDVVLAELRASVDITPLVGRVVTADGTLHEAEIPVMIADAVATVFDVTLRDERASGANGTETYTAVTIGREDIDSQDSLIWQLQRHSKLVKGELWDKVLPLPMGRSVWRYLDCLDSRYNRDNYNAARFAGGMCYEPGVFNVSRFAAQPESVIAVYGSIHAQPDPPVEITFRWQRYQPGVFEVNLPAELPERFGGRFNETRFGSAQPELFQQVVMGPVADKNYVVNLINGGDAERGIERSHLIGAESVTFVPVGFKAVEMPFRDPVYLQLGTENKVASLYLLEPGVPDKYVRLYASEEGVWGNRISIVIRPAGPAMYDLLVSYTDQRYENARKVVLGKNIEDRDLDLPAEVTRLVEPGPVGILQAKAAGVRATVTRDRA